MGKHTSHLLVTCDEVDQIDMGILMTGMAVHSNFLNWRLNDFHDYGHWSEEEHPPMLQMWHGFTFAGFPWGVFASLMASVSWRHESAIEIRIEKDFSLEKYYLREFFHAVREGKIKS